jgi:hypothetical protein
MRELTLATALVAFFSGPFLCQAQVAKDSGGPSELTTVAPIPVGASRLFASPVKLAGKVALIDGEPVPAATVWVSTFDSPAQHLAEVKTDPDGAFSLQFASLVRPPVPPLLFVGTSQPHFSSAGELVDFHVAREGGSNIILLLRKSGYSFEEPNLELIDGWILPRLARFQACDENLRANCKAFRSALEQYRKHPSDWETVVQVLQVARVTNIPEAQLLAAVVMMRVGSWSEAERLLSQDSYAKSAADERSFLQGVRWNFLRRPTEATRALRQTLRNNPRDPLVHLELGRAAVLAEDWAAALRWLNLPLRHRDLGGYARCLRVRSLKERGETERAFEEAMVLTAKMGKKPMPLGVQELVQDTMRPFEEEEEEIVPLTSVISQPVSELERSVPSLAGMKADSGPLPGGMDELLKQVGVNVERFFNDVSSTLATEEVRMAALDSRGRPRFARSEQFSYRFTRHFFKGQPVLEESRDPLTKHMAPQPINPNFMLTSGFASSLILFHPSMQPGVSYRLLGRQQQRDGPAYVVGFAQRPGVSRPLGSFQNHGDGNAVTFYVQGIAWISADRHQVMRLRTDLLEPIPEVRLNRETCEISYVPYRFSNAPEIFMLPGRVTVSVGWGRKRLRNEHLFLEYHLFASTSRIIPELSGLE